MAIYAIGDIQGHYTPLRHLLDIIHFDPAVDQLWLVGDLVNRGPESLQVLRFVHALGGAAKPVLGNHEIHLLARAFGAIEFKGGDSFNEILIAPDRDELINWIRHLPFVHIDQPLKTIMIHAGIHYKWGRKKLLRYSKEIEAILQGEECLAFLQSMYRHKSKQWKMSKQGWQRLQFIANCCIRLRYYNSQNKLDFNFKGPLHNHPSSLIPWFRHPKRRCRKWRIIFGHWAALGYLQEENVVSLDSGCIWGGQLTAIQLDCRAERIWQVSCN